jgi:hypothetical protein
MVHSIKINLYHCYLVTFLLTPDLSQHGAHLTFSSLQHLYYVYDQNRRLEKVT